MIKDQFDLPVTGAESAVAAYDRGVESLLRLRPEVVSVARTAVACDPDCVMARALLAYLGLTSSQAADARHAGALVQGLAGGNDRERDHLAAIRAWVAGDWRAAARRLDDVLDRYPMDALALFVGHQLDFFLGDSVNLRRRVETALGRWDPGHRLVGFIEGQWAFGLEETGDYAAAERSGRGAVEANPDDVWAIHAVAHVLEMTGRVGEGLDFLRAHRAAWEAGTLLSVHTAWHEALFRLELGEHDHVFRLYDRQIRPPDGGEAAMELLDAASLLWRLDLDGIDTGDRWAALADAWQRGAAADPAPTDWYVFNDLHAIMALVGAGRMGDALAVVSRLETFAREGDPDLTNRAMVSAAGLAAARGLAAFGQGKYAEAVAALAPVRDHLSIFGGSHAQRDVFQRTLLVAAERAGEPAFARRLARERLAARPSSAWALERLSRPLAAPPPP
jgi:tetratricopeptide (TPR) repeat protein